MSFFIADAMAQTAAAAEGPMGAVGQFLPLIVIMVAFYFILLRPQQKRAKEHKTMLEALKKGDEVVTGGGVIGRVIEVGENFVAVEVADGVQVKVQRGAISSLLPKGTVKGL
ncbi:preprotein translocase subunit YajC [Plasticicumulans acidivorans]|uniref:Sec translocon accessory complex subunit YajC n=1 Tax=Plasticicumulans acidivorans TaxID=886464 RepID=A0A317MQR6_9GAMM|nr:preprotein translocase subunit YajC [Plasticicumulans acidivorans]PWV59041.1 preprotein translocase subunit YajC [Plasticicumulans acidivorans]